MLAAMGYEEINRALRHLAVPALEADQTAWANRMRANTDLLEWVRQCCKEWTLSAMPHEEAEVTLARICKAFGIPIPPKTPYR